MLVRVQQPRQPAARSSSRPSIARPVLVFALSGAGRGCAGRRWPRAYALRSLSTDEALKDARRLTNVTGHGIVEPALTTDVVRGGRRDRAARPDRAPAGAAPDVARIKVWNAEGKILYSDEPLLIGRRFPLGADELAALRGRSTAAEVPDLSSPRTTTSAAQGDLTSVYLGLRAQDGTPVLFEEYLRSSAIAGDSRSLVRRFAPIGIVALLLVAVLQIPLAWRMASRIRNAQRDREQLLQRAIDASDQSAVRSRPASTTASSRSWPATPSRWPRAHRAAMQPEPVLRSGAGRRAAGTRNAIRSCARC